MPKANTTTSRSTIKTDPESDRRRSLKLGEMEPEILAIRCASALNETLLNLFLKEVDADAFPSIEPYKRSGFKVYFLTEDEDEILAHAIYQAGDIARSLHRKYFDEEGAST